MALKKMGIFKIKLWVLPEPCVMRKALNSVAPVSTRDPKSVYFSNEQVINMSTENHPSTNNADVLWHLMKARVNQLSGPGDVNGKQVSYVAAASRAGASRPPTTWWNGYTIPLSFAGSSNKAANPLGHMIAQNKINHFKAMLAPLPQVIDTGEVVSKTVALSELGLPSELVVINTTVPVPDLIALAKQQLARRVQEMKGNAFHRFEPQPAVAELSGDLVVAELMAPVSYSLYVEKEIPLQVLYDTETLRVSLSLSYEEKDQLGFVKDYNTALAERGALYEAGYATPPLLERPSVDLGLIKDPELSAELENWWVEFDKAQNSMVRTTDDATKLAETLAAHQVATPDLTLPELKPTVLAPATAAGVAGSGSTLWNSLWTGLKSVGAGTVDLLKSWGPLGTVGAYAGVKATNSISSLKSPLVWLAVGAGALLILN